MSVRQRNQIPAVVLFALTLTHALVTWPLPTTAVLFAGGVAVAFPLEVIGVKAAILQHRFRPQVVGVPLTILLAWPAVVYPSYRLALLMTPAGTTAAALAAVIATLWDIVTDPIMVRRGAWTYPESPISRPRFYGVPWWNFATWPCVVFATAMLPSLVAR